MLKATIPEEVKRMPPFDRHEVSMDQLLDDSGVDAIMDITRILNLEVKSELHLIVKYVVSCSIEASF